MDPKELELVYRLRKVLSDMNVVEAMELLKSAPEEGDQDQRRVPDDDEQY
jgi:transcription termination factor Rho